MSKRTANKVIFRRFLLDKGTSNVYGRTVFVQGGILYSLASQVCARMRVYHVERNGAPAIHAMKMARFFGDNLLVRLNRDRGCMTKQDHYRDFAKARLDSGNERNVFNVSEICAREVGESAEAGLHAHNLSEYHRHVEWYVKKASRARSDTRAWSHCFMALSRAKEACRYAMAFGHNRAASLFLEVSLRMSEVVNGTTNWPKIKSLTKDPEFLDLVASAGRSIRAPGDEVPAMPG